MSEPLDFCRVKKINEKGYGFLKSLYYPRDIFFHFTQIKEKDFLDKLNDMKRGDFFLYFTSKLLDDGRRKVDNIWYSIESVPEIYLSQFTGRIIKEFDSGSTNIFDILFAFKELREIKFIDDEQLKLILSSQRILNLPTTIIPYLSKEEIETFKVILKFDELKNIEPKPFWYQNFIDV
jgi:hypothetical protein